MDKDIRLQAYSLELVKLLAFLLRPSDSYKTDLPVGIAADLQVLWNKLIDKDIKGSVKSIHKICLGLWGMEWEEDFAQTMADPTIQYIALSQLKQTGGFKDVTLATPEIAKFEYLMQL